MYLCMCQPICLSICPSLESIYLSLSIHLSISIWILLYLSLPTWRAISIFWYLLSTYTSNCPGIWLSLYLSVCIHLSLCAATYLLRNQVRTEQARELGGKHASGRARVDEGANAWLARITFGQLPWALQNAGFWRAVPNRTFFNYKPYYKSTFLA